MEAKKSRSKDQPKPAEYTSAVYGSSIISIARILWTAAQKRQTPQEERREKRLKELEKIKARLNRNRKEAAKVRKKRDRFGSFSLTAAEYRILDRSEYDAGSGLTWTRLQDEIKSIKAGGVIAGDFRQNVPLSKLNPTWLNDPIVPMYDALGNQLPQRIGVAISFDCPCDCGTRIVLPVWHPLDGGGPVGTPLWAVRNMDSIAAKLKPEEALKGLTLNPCVTMPRRDKLCGSHFYVTNGQCQPIR